MTDLLSTHTFAVLSVAALFGGMAFFSFVMAPLVFIKLPANVAGGFIRQVFPWYYLSMGLLALAAGLLLAPAAAGERSAEAGLIAFIVLGFVVSRQLLMPRINQLRDAELAGDPDAGKRFQRLHRLSVIINALQLLASVAVLVLLLR